MYQYLGKSFATDKWSKFMDKWMKKKHFEHPLENFFLFFFKFRNIPYIFSTSFDRD